MRGNEREIGIRQLHRSSRPRTFRASFRDSEARRGSSPRCRKESTSAWPKVEAQTRFPRLRRPSLKRPRLLRLASYLGISETLSDNLRYRKAKAVTVSHGIVLRS